LPVITDAAAPVTFWSPQVLTPAAVVVAVAFRMCVRRPSFASAEIEAERPLPNCAV
jgi:hypothetical protein